MTFGDSRIPIRFWNKVAVNSSTGCWLWTGPLVSCNYAQFCIAITNKHVMAHRFAYENLVGQIPLGLELDHICRTRHCVNPEHLEPVTHRENSRRGTGPTAINAAKTHCHAGHEFTVANTSLTASRTERVCRICRRNRANDFKRKKRELRNYTKLANLC